MTLNRYHDGNTSVFRGPDGLFTIRVPLTGGAIDTAQLKALSDAMDGRAEGLHVTVRQGIEVRGVAEGDVDEVLSTMGAVGLDPGSTGRRVRNVVACPGKGGCRRGAMDTQALASRIADRYGGKAMPAKLKFGISGCPSGCTWPPMNDIGIMGMCRPNHSESDCIGCGKCVDVCKSGAIRLVDGVAHLDRSLCIRCGVCADVCPTDALTRGRSGYRVYAGGRGTWLPRVGMVVEDMVPGEEIDAVVDALMSIYVLNARDGMRMRDLIDSMGVEGFRRLYEETRSQN